MTDGIIVFDADAGALLFQRRFVRGFGLRGCAQQPSVADPVGLALQLYAFSRFCADIPSAGDLLYMQLSRDGGGVFFASGVAPEPTAAKVREVTIVLALFANGARREFGQRLAAALLQAFVEEQKRSRCGGGETEAAAALPPTVPPKIPPTLPPAPPPTAPRAGGVVSSSKRHVAGSIWRFMSLDDFFGTVPDLLVVDVAKHLPQMPRWLAVVHSMEVGTCPAVLRCCNNVAPPDATEAPAPRAPLVQPPAHGGRTSLARRMLLRVRTSASPERAQSANLDTVVPTAGAQSDRAHAATKAQPRRESPGRFFPRWPRGRSAPPPGDRALCATTPPVDQLPVPQAAEVVPGAHPSPCSCYLYGDLPAPLDSSGSHGGADAAAAMATMAASKFISSIIQRVAAGPFAERGWATMQLALDSSALAAGTTAPSRMQNVVVVGVDCRMSVVLPLEAFTACGREEESTAQAVREWQRSVYKDLRALALYLDFYGGQLRQVSKQAAVGPA